MNALYRYLVSQNKPFSKLFSLYSALRFVLEKKSITTQRQESSQRLEQDLIAELN